MCSRGLPRFFRRRSQIQSSRSLTESQPTQSLIKCRGIASPFAYCGRAGELAGGGAGGVPAGRGGAEPAGGRRAAGAAPAAGGAAVAVEFVAVDGSVMMLTGGIEAALGKSIG